MEVWVWRLGLIKSSVSLIKILLMRLTHLQNVQDLNTDQTVHQTARPAGLVVFALLMTEHVFVNRDFLKRHVGTVS